MRDRSFFGKINRTMWTSHKESKIIINFHLKSLIFTSPLEDESRWEEKFQQWLKVGGGVSEMNFFE